MTQSENNRHARQNGLINKKGENHHYSKLISSDIIEIRRLYNKEKWTKQMLSIKYKVCLSNIYHIVYYKTWKHI